MAIIPGSVRVGGFIAPTDSTDTYPVHDSIYGKGGHREVLTLVERDTITSERRREGMFVYVAEDGKTYQLQGGIDNTDWVEFVGGGGVDIPYQNDPPSNPQDGDLWVDKDATSSAGVTDHGDLTGLADDDHTQYLNEARHDLVDHSGLTGIPTTAGDVGADPAGTAASAVSTHESNYDHSKLHDAVSVVDSTSINLSITGQQLSADASFGTTAGTVAEGSHLHDEQAITPDTVIFDTATPGASTTLGAVQWDDTHQTIQVVTSADTTLQVGQETVVLCRNTTGVLIQNGYVVYVNGASGQKPTIALADADVQVTTAVLGVTTQDIGHNENGFVTVLGNVHGVPASGSEVGETWLDGDVLYLSHTPGRMTKVPPVAPAHAIQIGVVTNNSPVNGTIFVRPSADIDLSSLHDVLMVGVADGDVLEYDGTVWKNRTKYDAGLKAYHGFVDRTNSSLSFNNGTRTFTLTRLNPYRVYINGNVVEPSGNLSVQIGTGLGQHFIWFKSDGTLGTSQTAWSLLDTSLTPVATVHWDGATGIIGEERHDYRRNLLEHRNQHDSWGAQYVSGFTNTPTFNTNNTFSFTGGVIRDEEIYHTFTTPQTQCQIGYRVSDGASMTFDAVGTGFIKLNAGVPQYDNGGTLTNVTAGRYSTQWIFGTNRVSPAAPIVSIVGQSEHTTIAAAEAAPMPTLAGFSVAEWKLLYKVIYRNNVGTLQISQVDVMYNLSTGPAIVGSGPGTVAAATVSFSASGSISSTNVQAAIEELDAEKQPLDAQLTSLAGLSYTGNAAKVVAVKAAEDGFELVTPTGGSPTNLYFPFFKSNGSSDVISLTGDSKLPFILSSGSNSNIALTT